MKKILFIIINLIILFCLIIDLIIDTVAMFEAGHVLAWVIGMAISVVLIGGYIYLDRHKD